MVTIVVAVIGLCGSIIGSVIGIFANSKLISYRLEQLEKKVTAHNSLIERMYKVEQDIEVLKHEIEE